MIHHSCEKETRPAVIRGFLPILRTIKHKKEISRYHLIVDRSIEGFKTSRIFQGLGISQKGQKINSGIILTILKTGQKNNFISQNRSQGIDRILT